MFLFLQQNKNLLLGVVPESVGLLLFGVALIAITVFLRWVLNQNGKDVSKDENLEKIARKN